MKKLSKLQKKWCQDHAGEDDHLDYLMSFLYKLKVFNKKQYVEIKTEIHNTVYKWMQMERDRRARHLMRQEDKQTYQRVPQSIKPTRARSRY